MQRFDLGLVGGLALGALFGLAACSDSDEDATGSSTTDAAGTSEDGTTGSSVADATFPPIASLVGDDGRAGFRFGAASAATQIEDNNPNVDWYAWTADGPEGLGNGEFVGDAARGFSKAVDDVELLTRMGLDAYRFSIEWARIEPQRDVIDDAGVAHYDAFIDALIAAGIRPMVTLHHFSNPTWIDDPRDTECTDGPSDSNLCGWDNPDGGPLVVEEFAEHAAFIAEHFGDRVDEWVTLNEPVNYLLGGYGLTTFPPGKNGLLLGPEEIFIPATRNLLQGHADAYRAVIAADLVDADGDGHNAVVGMTKGAIEWVPARDNEVSGDPEDLEAREKIDYVYHRLVVESLLNGTFDSDLDGTPDEEHEDWQQTLDWLGVQYYFRAGVTASPGLLPLVGVTPCFAEFDFGACIPQLDPTYFVPMMGYEHYPPGLYERLASYGTLWPELPMVVTESGLATSVGERRSEAVVRALEQIERARAEGFDVRGYYHWSLFDNFEWAEGFEPRFGLYTVDYDTYQRNPTDAVSVLTEITAARGIPDEIRATYGGVGPMTPER